MRNPNFSNEETSQSGLPWPEHYLSLLPAIKDSWGIESEIYLTRKLSGKSGSVFQVISFQNQLVDVQEKELIARQDYLQSLTDLDTAMGTTLEAWQIDYNTAYNGWPGEAR